MSEKNTDLDLDFEEELSDDIHIQRISVPGGWIYITYVKNKVNGEYQTTQLSTCYVPGRR
jgi:hypothetical protein